MTWTKIWMDLFGRTALWGLNMGFWVSMVLVVLIVIFMNVIFWSMKPQDRGSHTERNKKGCKRKIYHKRSEDNI